MNLNNNSFNENNTTGVIIGTLKAEIDQNDIAGDTHTFGLNCTISGTDDNLFNVAGDKLHFNAVADYEVKSSYAICVRATDAAGEFVDQNLTIYVNDINEAPVFTSATDLIINEDRVHEHTLAATDPENSTLTYIAVSLPSWITLTGNKLAFTPLQAQVGNHTLTVKVSDGVNEVTQTINITVNNINDAPVVTSVAPTTATKRELYEYTISATDEDGDNLTYSAMTLPSWLNFNPVTRKLSGTPDNAEAGNSYSVKLRVSDGITHTDQDFIITVADKNFAPIISDQIFSIAENSANNTEVGQVVASDPDTGQSLSYVIVSGNEAGIFTLSNDGRLTVLDNTNLDYESLTQVVLRVRVSDNGSPVLHAEANVTVDITDVNEAPVFVSGNSITMNEGEVKEHALLASDPENSPLIFSASSLPAWISLSGNKLSFNPGQAQVGSHSIEVAVTDGLNVVKMNLNITVRRDTEPPVIMLLGLNNLELPLGAIFIDPGVTCQDSVSSCTITTHGSVDVNTPGEYIITYIATDAAGNQARIERKIIVLQANQSAGQEATILPPDTGYKPHSGFSLVPIIGSLLSILGVALLRKKNI